MVWMIVAALMMCLFLVLLYSALIVASDADDAMEIRAERIMTDVTPVPMPGETWVRYPLPLDDELQRYIEHLCKQYEVDAAIIFAIIEAESNCDPYCVGDSGHSYGLMQIWEECHHDRCVRLGIDNLFSPYQNVLVGIDFFAELMNCGHGIDWALSWYNSGQGGATEYALRIQNRAEQLRESSMQMEG